MKVQRDGRGFTVEVTADGEGLVSHAGSALLAQVADKTGLTGALSLAGMRERRAGHDPGRVVRELAVMLADGGDRLAELGAGRDRESLVGEVASDSTAFRPIERIARHTELLERLRAAHARGRKGAWRLGVRPERVAIDLDATLITSHSDKEGAAGNFKGGFGFHPPLAYFDESAEAAAGLLRPGNAGANTAADQIAVSEQALEQIPTEHREQIELLLRADSAGAAHELLDWCREGNIRYSLGYELTEPVREAILCLEEDSWVPAMTEEGEPREGAGVAEITQLLERAEWPEGARFIVPRERPHPGAQRSSTDRDGHRFQVFMTDQRGSDVAALERRHRQRARVEDEIRADKHTGLGNLPFRDFEPNAVRLELGLIAHDPIAWTKAPLLPGELARCEPKRLRYRLLQVAARLAFHGRQAKLRLQASWPWARHLAQAFARLKTLPVPAG